MAQKQKSKDLIAKKLRTGEIAVLDATKKTIILVAAPGKETTVPARVISGASFKALQESLGDLVLLG